MKRLTIEIKNRKALKLIYDLEDLNLIQIVGQDLKESKTNLSNLLAGCISPEQADIIHKELTQMRD